MQGAPNEEIDEMAYNRSTAKKLLTATEYELFQASLAKDVQGLTEARLRSKITRTRRLRDKYQDLLRRQKVTLRARSGTKAGRTGVANARTEQKRQLFDETLQRFEERLRRVEAERAGAKRVAARKTAKELLTAKREAKARQAEARRQRVSPKAPAKAPRKGAGGGLGSGSERAREARHAMQFQSSRARPIQAHVRASTRRAQARRDTRR
jgi:hypothetical protein